MLLETAGDKDPSVKEIVNTSLRKIARKHANQVLLSCCTVGKKLQKTNTNHLVSILAIMETVCQDCILDIDGNTIMTVIEFSLDVMTQNVGYEPEVQLPASGILVALGNKHYVQVMEALLNKLQIGVVPHYMVPHTLGTLANSNAFGVIPYLKNVLGIMLPLLGGLKSDPLKQAFSYGKFKFINNVEPYLLVS